MFTSFYRRRPLLARFNTTGIMDSHARQAYAFEAQANARLVAAAVCMTDRFFRGLMLSFFRRSEFLSIEARRMRDAQTSRVLLVLLRRYKSNGSRFQRRHANAS